MTINGKTFNLIREIEVKAYADADKGLPLQSHNPIYVDAYNAQMRLNAYNTIELGDGYPTSDNPVYMAEYNAIKQRKEEEWQTQTANERGFDTWDQLMDAEYNNDHDLRV